MQKSSIRRGATALVALSAALVVTGCRAGDAETGADVSSSTAAPTAPVRTPPASTPAAPTTGCTADSLEASAAQAADRPQGTGTGAAVVRFTNTGAKACVLRGHPTVAGAANGSPELNVPLQVTPTGTASPVTLAPGGRAWVKLTFVQVQGEGDGYCASGSAPVVYPTMVIGLPGAGKHQVALDDGQFAECDGTVTATAVSAARPS
ncbi:DUF4232 domain-containing protein [Streptomyces sp. NPDC101175]|uniref:DUF4232 domain-containing protein n=1 Tax=Streptomyces sp. NPDC101175 TaxID=3366123 RepID=UPI0038341258